MMKFLQKTTFITNFESSKRDLYVRAIEVFKIQYPKIDIWIENESFDSLGRFMEDNISLHSYCKIQDKFKWRRFFKKTNKKELMKDQIGK